MVVVSGKRFCTICEESLILGINGKVIFEIKDGFIYLQADPSTVFQYMFLIWKTYLYKSGRPGCKLESKWANGGICLPRHQLNQKHLWISHREDQGFFRALKTFTCLSPYLWVIPCCNKSGGNKIMKKRTCLQKAVRSLWLSVLSYIISRESFETSRILNEELLRV